VLFRPPAAAAAAVNLHDRIVGAARAALETDREEEAPERKRDFDREAPLALRASKIKGVEVHATEVLGIRAEFLAQAGYRGFHTLEGLDAVTHHTTHHDRRPQPA